MSVRTRMPSICRWPVGIAAVVVAAVVVSATVPQAAAADAETTAADAPTTSIPPSVEGVGAPRSAQRGEGGVSAAEFGFVFLGRPGSVAAGFDRYYWMTAAGLGVRSACSGSHTSAGAAVMCLVPPAGGAASPGYSSRCATDARGRVMARYLVPADAAHTPRRVRDTLLIFEDRDRDTAHDHRPGRVGHEPAAAIDIPVAKQISYVALGDSYSSGEAGRPDAAGFAGSYQSGINPADAHCRRWSNAYPSVIARDFLSSAASEDGIGFTTFACSGAITHNVHDPRSPSGEATQDDLIATNRPSHAAPRLRHDPDTNRLLPAPDDWEPRQAASLAAAQSMTDVDMITITIGGNDAGFGEVVRACATPLFGNLDSTCNQDDLALDWSEVQDRIKDALVRVRTSAPQASVYVLGYPPITPRPTPCPADARDCPELGINQIIDDCQALSAQDILAHSANLERLPAVLRPLGFLVKWSPLGIATSVSGLTLDEVASGIAKIDHVEAGFLWSSAGALNQSLQRAAAAAGVHFVDIRGQGQGADASERFAHRDPCAANPWLHGFVADPGEAPVAVSGKSFHPNAAGHSAHARILAQYIQDQVASGADLNEAGLPANPEAVSQ